MRECVGDWTVRLFKEVLSRWKLLVRYGGDTNALGSPPKQAGPVANELWSGSLVVREQSRPTEQPV